MLESKNYEIGNLPDKKDNRYWKIKLRKINIFSRYKKIGIVFCFIKKIIGIVLFFILLMPIIIIASIISFLVRNKIQSKTEHSKEIKKALRICKFFFNVYPTRTYSSVSKSLEVGFFELCDLKSPILEIAVGDGYLSSLIFKDKKCFLDVGGDMIYETILSAKKYSHIKKLVIFDAESLPFLDESFNTVVMNNLIHHLPSRKKALNEVERVLRPGGQFIFIDNLSGWINYTFDSRLLRFLHLGFIAKKLETFKLRLFAQKLLTSSEYWNDLVSGSQMEVLINKDFMSKRAMTISSIFEYLNLLQGQPTRESMKLLLKINFLRKFIDKRINNIIRYLIINESELIKKGDGAFLFVVLKKKDGKQKNRDDRLKYICPGCKSDLLFKNNKLICKKCEKIYIIRNGIPILLSYKDDLINFDKYLDTSDKKKIKDY
ncbi:methyltransferase domain-containing protein, partial [Patescibacteria group bacterium]|nr:methyltransferase domain-containing protein [Patescibacteria group bacterium]